MLGKRKIRKDDVDDSIDTIGVPSVIPATDASPTPTATIKSNTHSRTVEASARRGTVPTGVSQNVYVTVAWPGPDTSRICTLYLVPHP
ncbi:hypothetical protein P5V15_005029 [Pogonomyrmex californicus]